MLDDGGQTLPGVTILLKGTTIGVVTDIDGRFKIELPKQGFIDFAFSLCGYGGSRVECKIKLRI